MPGLSPAGGRRAPDRDRVMTLLADFKEYYRGFHQQCQEAEDFYFLRFPQDSVPGIPSMVPATARAKVNIATDHVDVNNLSIDVPLASPRAAARAERIQKFLIGTWMQTRQPVLRTSVRHAFLYGIAWRKRMFAPELWPDAPRFDDYHDAASYREALADFMEKRSLSYPLISRNVNPKNLIWDDSRAGRKWAIEFYQRDVQDIARRYPEWVGKTAGNRLTDWVEYWDDTWCMYLAGGEVVWGPYEHGYGFVPYVPLMPNNALDFDDGPPQDRYQGILYPIRNLLQAQARLLSQHEAILRTVSWRTLDFFGPPQIAKQTMEEYQLFGGKNVIPTGVEVKPSPVVQVPPEIMSELSRVEGLIDEATFPDVLRGARPTGISTGFGVSVLAGMGRLVFQGIADGLARSIEEENQCILKLVENKIQGRITVHARTDIHSFDQSIGPDDINGYYENTVKIKAEAPEERERESLLAMRLWDGGTGIIDLYEAQRRAGVANPLEMQNRQAAERIMSSPEFQLAQAQAALELLGYPQQQAEASSLTGQVPRRLGNTNLGGAQLPRPGERNLQEARIDSRNGVPSVFPQGMGGLDMLGNRLGNPAGGAVPMPNGRKAGG